MSEAETGTEGGGAPLPPKRPTIIRPPPQQQLQDGPVPSRSTPARPAPPPPGNKPVSSAPRPPAVPEPVAVRPQKPPGPQTSHGSFKHPDPPAKESSKIKSQGSVKKRPEITIVDARPMSQAGFRDMKPELSKTRDSTATAVNNGSVPAIPSRPPPASSSSTAHSTPPPTQPPPPIPSSRPEAPPPAVPHPPRSSSSTTPAPGDPDPPPKPSRSSILLPNKPARPAGMKKEASEEDGSASHSNSASPPPPLPKRSPVLHEAGAAGLGDAAAHSAPSKPARSPRVSADGQEEGKETGDGAGKDEGAAAPRKMRPSIIRPPPRPKPSEEGRQRPTESANQHPTLPTPPPPPARPVAVVTGSPRASSPTDSHLPSDAVSMRGSRPPVPAVRPKSAAVIMSHHELSEKGSQPSEVSVEKVPEALDRPRPPVPTSRPHPLVSGSLPTQGGSGPDSLAPSRPHVPSSRPVSMFSSSSTPAKPAGHHASAAPTADDSLYAVSDPFGDSVETPVSENQQPSRPLPPIPKSRPQSGQPPKMSDRPLPSCPSHSDSTDHSYEDIDSVRDQQKTLAKTKPLPEKPPALKKDHIAKETAKEHDPEDITALYAVVKKPPKKDSNAACPEAKTNPSEGVAPNPFGVKLKHVGSDNATDSGSGVEATEHDKSEAKKPLPAPKPKPNILPKPHSAGSTPETSPRKEAAHPVASDHPPVAAKPDLPQPQEQRKPITAKRPTIIRPLKPSPSTEGEAQKVEEDDAGVTLREKNAPSHPRPHSELPVKDDDLQSSAPSVNPPVPSKRPVTIIGFPHHKQKSVDTAAPSGDEQKPSPSPPVPRQRHTPTEVPPNNDSEDSCATAPPSASQKDPSSAGPPVSRPPPPRPDNKPPKPLSEDQSESPPPPTASASSRRDPEGAPARAPSARPPSPAPPRPSNKPPAVEGAEVSSVETQGAHAGPSTPRFAPPIKRTDTSFDHDQSEEKIVSRPSRPSGPPPRPGSMPPIKPPLSVSKSTPSDSHSQKPTRPQPARPSPPKESKHSAPPLPKRPGFSHPLYDYMAGIPHAIAMHDYSASQVDEVSFLDGDTVLLVKRVDAQWLVGKVGDKEGIFPQAFVNIIHPLHDEIPTSAIDDFINEAFDDALEEKPDLLQGPRCRARFDFDGEGEGDLTFEDGDVIQLLAHCGADWLKGDLDGKVGMFPASFVEIIEDLPESKVDDAVPRGAGSEVTALFDFSGEAGELSFQAGDKICVLSQVNEQWLFGQCMGSKGTFPASFVDEVPLDLPHHKGEQATHDQTEGPEQQNKHMEPKRFGIATYTFEKTQEGDLELREGDYVEILEEVGDDWFRGRIHGKEGLFPASFVEMEPAGAAASAAMASGHFVSDCAQHKSDTVVGRALYDFNGETQDELTFKAGDEIAVGSAVSPGSEWQWGELNGKRGMFPAAFLDRL